MVNGVKTYYFKEEDKYPILENGIEITSAGHLYKMDEGNNKYYQLISSEALVNLNYLPADNKIYDETGEFYQIKVRSPIDDIDRTMYFHNFRNSLFKPNKDKYGTVDPMYSVKVTASYLASKFKCGNYANKYDFIDIYENIDFLKKCFEAENITSEI